LEGSRQDLEDHHGPIQLEVVDRTEDIEGGVRTEEPQQLIELAGHLGVVLAVDAGVEVAEQGESARESKIISKVL